ncbi:ABC transporter substrate-binding protein [Roseomonas haemaphysalidis]|uniref:Extracellular solute-binding protein n=1 Tax=Roseomonas haemaphysalidis TaxID=2768162 RepID=A0ABS3KM74_9PROT|nr:extracellular solute-binding protein [Roseomonas haemaphysalidis]MBO1078065.1 extracellular solute-binding protein [Roseomonas haemaphysalidis]
MRLTRRAALGTAIATLALPGLARAQAKRLDILSHRVHQQVLTQGAAGDLTAPWRQANGAELSWTTADIGPLQDRLLREASLPSSDFGIGYLLNSRATPEVARLLTPLDDLLRDQPVAQYDDIAPGLREAMRVNGRTIAIPVRHATNGLFYNQALLEQQGIAAPPGSFEEFLDLCRRLTFRPAGAAPVTGLVMTAALAAYPVMFARAFGGDFITLDYKVIPDPEAMTKAIAAIRGLFEAGALPRSYATITNEDQVTWLQQGRAAFAILPFSRHAQLNRAEQSRFPGRIQAMEMPMSTTAPAGSRMAAAVEFWSMAIPANARDKLLAWSFLRAMSAPDVTLGAARNGNGSVRLSTYADAGFARDNPVAAVEAEALSRARVPFPAFAEASRAEAIFVEEVQSAVLGRKEPARAVEDSAARIKPLLPA